MLVSIICIIILLFAAYVFREIKISMWVALIGTLPQFAIIIYRLLGYIS